MDGTCQLGELWRMVVQVNDIPHSHLALNDVLFAHYSASATARYLITDQGMTQSQQSSGVWIATSAGSTGSIHSAGGLVCDLQDQRLQYRVRELFRPYGREELDPKHLITGGFLGVDFFPHIKNG